MEDRFNIEQQMIRYLLGELSITDRLEIEMEYFTDPEIFDLLQAVEHDLIEGYVNGKLSPSGRARFERNYLTTKGRREQVQFFQTLSSILPLDTKRTGKFQASFPAFESESLDQIEKQSIWDILLAPFRGPRLALGVSMAVALLALGIFGAMKLFEIRENPAIVQNNPKEKAPVKDIAVQPESAEINPKAQPKPTVPFKIVEGLPATPTPQKVPALVSFTWTIPGLRVLGDNTPRMIRIPPGADTVQIRLNFPDLTPSRYSRFTAALQNSDGREVWRRSDIRANKVRSGSSMVLNVPAKNINPGPYSLVLSGNKNGEWVDIREFYIKVER
jgi:hypothetical protein